MKLRLILILFVFVMFVARPSPALACSGLLDCAFGWTERTEVRNDRMLEQERIQAQRDAEVARIEADAAERLREADAKVEEMKQRQFESEAARDIAIAEAQARRDEYQAMIAGLVTERTAEIDSLMQTQLASLQHTADIHIAGITETGKTERTRIAGGWIAAVVALIVVGVVTALWSRRQHVTVMLPGPNGWVALPGSRRELPYDNTIDGDIVRLRK